LHELARTFPIGLKESEEGPVVMLASGVHEGKARQEGLQVEPHVTLGGSFAPAVLGPIHTPGHQLNGGRVDDVNQALEPEGELGTMPGAKTRMELLQMFEHRQEQRLGHFRVALSVVVRVVGRRLESFLVAPGSGACERLVWSGCHTFAEQPGGRLDVVI
jgi:hypothetical protein